MQFILPIFQPLFWSCRKTAWICQFWGHGLALNRWLIQHQWLSQDQAVQIQTWLIACIHAEQKHSCQVHLNVLKECFATGEIPSTPSNLGYFQELQSLYSEGRYETMLIQLYQLDRKAASNLTENNDDNDSSLNNS